MAYAHSRNEAGDRHGLVAHLRAVAELAATFAGRFGAADPAFYAGLWHDLGKFHCEFQRYLLACEQDPGGRRRGPDHKAAGSVLASRHLGLGALLIQGHHGGLRSPSECKRWLAEHGHRPAVQESLALARSTIPDLEPTGPVPLPAHIQHDALAAELYLRMLFSALVDADYLDTERHFRPETAAVRPGPGTRSMGELWERFLQGRDQLVASREASPVDALRGEIYQACLAAAGQPPGVFRLRVPTGGGKTLSGMAFALRHAARHGLDRVIVAVPFITITEQTAQVYRRVFYDQDGAHGIVLEHHSGSTSPVAAPEDFHRSQVWARLAAENWDAPVVVTTTVQLFESLFSNQTSATRKLHRLARSVIVLDEAQALPPKLLAPILNGLRGLCAHFGATVVLSTATQPAFEAIPAFAGLPATEIVPDARRFFRSLSRVSYEWSTKPSRSWAEIAEIARSSPQALVVVNTKKDALALLDQLAGPDTLHLSTLLCGAHRRQVIAEVTRRLAAGDLCRVVSTQVVEAGVDLDFPLVLRALGPLDSIIQAAGRCNREGRLRRGRVIVFRPTDGGMPQGAYRAGTQETSTLLGDGPLDLDDPALPERYFRQLFQSVDTDDLGIQKLRKDLLYPETACKFRMIDDNTVSVVVRYGTDQERDEVQRLLARLRNGAADARLVLRKLQPYVVNVRAREADRYTQSGLINPIISDLGEWLGSYDSVRGLTGDHLDVETLVI